EATFGRDTIASADLTRPRRVLGDHEGRVGLGMVQREREAERARKAVVLEALPALPVVVGSVDAAVVLLPEPAVLPGVEQPFVYALADLGKRVFGKEVGGSAVVRGGPRL